jgi:hypothetical protein
MVPIDISLQMLSKVSIKPIIGQKKATICRKDNRTFGEE